MATLGQAKVDAEITKNGEPLTGRALLAELSFLCGQAKARPRSRTPDSDDAVEDVEDVEVPTGVDRTPQDSVANYSITSIAGTLVPLLPMAPNPFHRRVERRFRELKERAERLCLIVEALKEEVEARIGALQRREATLRRAAASPVSGSATAGFAAEADAVRERGMRLAKLNGRLLTLAKLACSVQALRDKPGVPGIGPRRVVDQPGSIMWLLLEIEDRLEHADEHREFARIDNALKVLERLIRAGEVGLKAAALLAEDPDDRDDLVTLNDKLWRILDDVPAAWVMAWGGGGFARWLAGAENTLERVATFREYEKNLWTAVEVVEWAGLAISIGGLVLKGTRRALQLGRATLTAARRGARAGGSNLKRRLTRLRTRTRKAWRRLKKRAREAGEKRQKRRGLRRGGQRRGQRSRGGRGRDVDDPSDPFDPVRERPMAEHLAGEGRTVERMPRSGAGRGGDALVDGVPSEFKKLDPGATSSTIKTQVSHSLKRGGQARDMYIDARGSGLTKAEAERALRRIGHPDIHRGKLDNVTIVGDGFEVKTTFP